MRSAPFLGLSVAATLSGCAVPEARLRAGLIDAGLPQPIAACMADRMVDRLSLAQLMRIADLPKATASESVPQFLRRVRALGDLEILGVATSSAAACA
ncbi:hypothetical protein [Sphingomonas turrisvirgatae]|uniref:Lipoprotein n=1 Tax=Sphingomonas turrisvirgatae TaxID=1888892 RepID=A0A1E3LVA7_9SPHN|nr:hypothetical protein [Sphingomonas turrisvirgatae]ODP37649.1 hypothetical protein BFL28_16925 [Sphingomonas turrisvirgatae]